MNIVATDDIVVNVKDLLVKCFSSSNLLIFNSITVHGYHIKTLVYMDIILSVVTV